MDCMEPRPYVANVEQLAGRNSNFRTELWTGKNVQMTLMCIPPCTDIGFEMHEETDQMLRIEQGRAVVTMGRSKNQMDGRITVCKGDVIFVPAGTWHNVMNTGRSPLRISSVYAPPKHRIGTVHRTKEEAMHEED